MGKTAIVLLGAPNDENGGLSQIALERANRAIEECARQPGALVLPTGGWGDHFNTTDKPHAFYSRKYLVEHGVAASRFLPHAESRNTVEDAALAKPILETAGVDAITIVTSDFHVGRAKFLFRRALKGVKISFAPSVTHLPEEELAKLSAHETRSIKMLAERFHGEEIEAMARGIGENAATARLVLIGGPSSAGKTTFAKRLTHHLNNNGIGTLVISTDDYFVGDALNPRDKNGNLDYEHIKAIDLDQLGANLRDLIAGRPAVLPRFDFHTHAPAKEGHEERLPDGSVIVIEGLHSLNPELTPSIPAAQKHLIFADTATNLYDEIPLSKPADGRLIRRIIRDSKYRSRGAEETIGLWQSVCDGEEKWIRPFTGNAAETFDTTLAYEPGVLRHYAEPLLSAISPASPAYIEARRLLGSLTHFKVGDEEGIPGYSILREYIGGSIIQY